MRFIIIKAIFFLLINVGAIIYSLSAYSVELVNVITKKSLKENPIQLKSFKIINLISDIKYDYLHNMARYAESKMANINARTLVIIYPVGRRISNFPPSDILFGATHEVVLTEPQINEVVLRASSFFEDISCDNSIVLKFETKLQAGTGNIIINNLDGTTIDTIAVDSSNVIFNDNTVTIHYNRDKLHSNINSKDIYEARVNIIIPAGAVKDMSGDVFGEVSVQNTLPLVENATKRTVSKFNEWLQIGGGGANTLSSPFLVDDYAGNGGGCDDYRVVIISVDIEKGKAWEGIDKKYLQSAFFHEAYHSFQQDLTMCGESGDNDEWVVEGAAEYFAQHILAWAQDHQEDFVSLILKTALTDANFLGKELVDAGGENWGLSYKGMGVLRLMIELGWLDESRILDGSLFHDCASVREFNNSNPKIQFVKNNWHQIEEKNGVFQFKESVLKDFSLNNILSKKKKKEPPKEKKRKNNSLPNFEIINLFDKSKKLSNIDINNEQVLINFFASWCAPCRYEHPLFFELKNNYPNMIIVGINYQDRKSDALKFLEKEGNPYHFVGLDNSNSIGLEFGISGLPETFLTNNKGEIIYRYLGPLTKKVVQNEISPLLQ